MTVAGGALYGTGKALPIIGYGYVIGSLYRDYKAGRLESPEGVSKTISDYAYVPIGTEVAEAGKGIGRGLVRTYTTYSPTARVARAVGTAAEAVKEAFQ